MVYPIVKFGNRVLETPAEAVTEFGDNLKTLVTNMFESMYAAQGVGLAAPQIGIGKRIAVIDISFQRDPGAKIVLVNPEIIRPKAARPWKRAASVSLASARKSRGRKRWLCEPKTRKVPGLNAPEAICWRGLCCMRRIIWRANYSCPISAP